MNATATTQIEQATSKMRNLIAHLRCFDKEDLQGLLDTVEAMSRAMGQKDEMNLWSAMAGAVKAEQKLRVWIGLQTARNSCHHLADSEIPHPNLSAYACPSCGRFFVDEK